VDKQSIIGGRITQGMTFNQKVWAMTARIPRGRVCTYGEIAKALKTRAYRAVGIALNRNPFAPEVPCHRVVGSDGNLVGFASGLKKKRQMLMTEGVRLVNGKVPREAFIALGATAPANERG
jgi:methylated-DNA-[protein]-cysteine S-methyltransferase